MIAVYEATRVAGRGTYAVLVCQDERAALRTLFRYATEPFEASRTLHAAVVSRTANTIELETGVSIAAYPCRPAAIRGLRSRAAICDELAFFRSSEGYATDVEMLRALRPTLATTGGKLIVLSVHRTDRPARCGISIAATSARTRPTLVWTASAPEMNPSLPADYLERMAEDDPEAYRSEVLGEFRAGISDVLRPRRARVVRRRPIAASCCRAKACAISRTSIRAAAGRTPSLWRSAIATTTA